jgi:CBS domain-containing protein
MPELSVRECMHEGVISCDVETSLDEVAATMRTEHISAVVVVTDGLAAGVISQTDLVNIAFVEPYVRYWRGMTARHIMSSPVVSVRPDTPLDDALELLRQRRIHRLVVTEPTGGGEKPVGILSMTDVARVLGQAAAAVNRRDA